MIQLSEHTKKLFADLLKNEEQFTPIPDRMNHVSLLFWLDMRANEFVDSVKDKTLPLAAIQAALLTDYKRSLKEKPVNKAKKKKKWSTKLKLAVLTITGTLLFGAEGFDSMIALVHLIKMPLALSYFLVGLFTTFSIMVFYGFDLKQISNNLGVKTKNAGQLIDYYLQQINNIQTIQKTVANKIAEADPKALRNYKDILETLLGHMTQLQEARSQFKRKLNRPWFKAAQYFTLGLGGILFFGSGYFTGEAVALKLVGAFAATATPGMWPVIAISVLIGLAAFSIYWFVERPGLQNLIGRWVGLDKEKVKQFSDEKKTEQNINSIEATLDHTKSRLSQFEEERIPDKGHVPYKDRVPDKENLVNKHSSRPKESNHRKSALYFFPSSAGKSRQDPDSNEKSFEPTVPASI